MIDATSTVATYTYQSQTTLTGFMSRAAQTAKDASGFVSHEVKPTSVSSFVQPADAAGQIKFMRFNLNYDNSAAQLLVVIKDPDSGSVVASYGGSATADGASAIQIAEQATAEDAAAEAGNVDAQTVSPATPETRANASATASSASAPAEAGGFSASQSVVQPQGQVGVTSRGGAVNTQA